MTREHGHIPEGFVVFVRTGWSKAWPVRLATLKEFPGSGSRRSSSCISNPGSLFHSHKPLNTDSTRTSRGEDWLNGTTATCRPREWTNVDQVPEASAS